MKNGGEIGAPAQGSITKRVPLAELPLNTQSAFSDKNNGVVEHPKGYDYSLHGVVDGILTARTMATPVVPAESLHLSDFETPRKEPEHSKPLDYFSTTDLLDDFFDESVWEQIDDLCRQKSAGKSVGQEPDHNFQEEDLNEKNITADVNMSSRSITAIESLRTDDLLNEVVDFDAKEITDSWQSIQHSVMPVEYLKYLQSLNDRQREAACTDISIPLMIVAGPGSGKVFTFSYSITC